MTRKEDWAHCPGEQYPADIGSRGELASRLRENELWWRGPAWLSGPKEGWPVSEISETLQSVDEERKVNVAVAGVTTKSGISTVNEISKFSRLGRLLSLPEEVRNDEEESETGFLRRFRYLARLRIHFWNRWRKEYLADLREHHRSKEEGLSKVIEGDVVLVHEDNVKENIWKMGKAVRLITGKDGEVRGAKLKLITKGKAIFVNRALQKLYPLEVRSVIRE